MSTDLRRIGFLADTHSRVADGSDLPQQALDAFEGVDLIVHLGDVGRKGILDRLGAIAPVMVPVGDNKGYIGVGKDEAPVKVLTSGDLHVGVTFNLSAPDKKIAVDGATIEFPDGAVADLLQRRFKQAVHAVAYGGTHVQHQEEREGVLFFNPGSPNLPSDKRGDDDLGSVAVLDLSTGKPRVELVRLTR
jgi:putative phosphoesterase